MDYLKTVSLWTMCPDWLANAAEEMLAPGKKSKLGSSHFLGIPN